MIRPRYQDIGRDVIYRARPGADPEHGVITSLPRIKADDGDAEGMLAGENGTHVFVRFRGPGGELTALDRLDWA